MDGFYLDDLKNRPEESSGVFELIRRMRESGGEYPQIWHLFAVHPQFTKYLERFTQGVMRDPSPLSPGLRELIAAYTSRGNHCVF